MTHQEVEAAYRRYGHLVARRCRRILRDQQTAEDALQEVFVRLWRYGDGFNAAEAKVLWLYRVADRCCFDQIARRNRRAESSNGAIDDVPLPGGNHGQALEDRELVMSFLDRFDDRVRQIAVYHYVDEMTQEDIATATGWSRQTVFKKLTFLKERAASLRAVYYSGGRT